MNAEHTILESRLKRTSLVINAISLVSTSLVVLGIVYGFYYKTINTQNDIKELKTDFKELQIQMKDSEIFQGTYKTEIQSLKEQINNIEKSVDKIDTKLDKIIFQTR